LGQDIYDGFMLSVEQNAGKLGGVPIITGVACSNVMMAVSKQITDKQVFLIGANAGPSPLAGAGC
jgi:branched-chain amino acid transport system substrate-binding protein